MVKTERKKCSQCGTYSRKVGRCLMGYVNPPTQKGARQIMLSGFGNLCPWSPLCQKVIKEVLSERRRE